MQQEQLWDILQAKICVKCIDGDGAGNCRLGAGRECALKLYLPLIVESVNRVSSDRVVDYVSELRGIVCAQCKYEHADGRCSLRDSLDCALDVYFPLIIDAVEQISEKPAHTHE